MTTDELFTLAGKHADEVWGEYTTGPLGKGREVLKEHGIDSLDATALAMTVVEAAHKPETLEGKAALFMQGLIFGLWLDTGQQ